MNIDSTTAYKNVLFLSYIKCYECNKSPNTQEYKKLFREFVKYILKNLTFENASHNMIAIKLDPVSQQLDAKIPLMFFQNSDLIINSWNVQELGNSSLNDGNIDYLKDSVISKSASLIQSKYPSLTKILDIGSGNGGSVDRLSKCLGENYKIICTDPSNNFRKDLGSNISCHKESLNAIQAIKKLGSQTDVVLIMSPTPSNFDNRIPFLPKVTGAGFDPILIDYMIKNNIKKDIIIIGECGAGDSIQGMHNFLINNPKLEVKYKIVQNTVHEQRIPISIFKTINFKTRVMKLIYFIKIL